MRFPRHQHEPRPWRQGARAGTRADRMLTEITVSLPPRIAGLRLPLAPELSSTIEEAVREIAALDSGHGDSLVALGIDAAAHRVRRVLEDRAC